MGNRYSGAARPPPPTHTLSSWRRAPELAGTGTLATMVTRLNGLRQPYAAFTRHEPNRLTLPHPSPPHPDSPCGQPQPATCLAPTV